MFAELWNGITNFFKDKIYDIVDLLPDSPFTSVTIPTSVSRYLQYINWFIPVGTILTILLGWVTCIGVYYLVSSIMRMFKVVSG